MIKFLDLKSQYQSIKLEIDEAIQGVIENYAFIGGKYVSRFEENFAKYIGVKNCVGVGNGTDALEIAIESLDLPKGSEIIVPANSFIASAEAVSRSGYKIVFCDVNLDDYTINIRDIKRRVTSKTAAIIAVHLYGHSCDMDPLLNMAERYNLKIIEDCAQAHGAKYKGMKVGCIGDIGCFSFYPGKNLGAYGDGGAITTNNNDLAVKCRMIANHGRIVKYEHKFEGRNSRLDGMQAAILDVKLKYLDGWTEHRIMIAKEYLKRLKNVEGITLPVKKEWSKHVYHLFVIRVSNRDALQKKLRQGGIQTGVHYPTILPKLYAYKNHKQADDFNLTSNVGCVLMSLPIGEHVSSGEAAEVALQIKRHLDSV